ncbi:MAG: T9SS type A sorting domain-containing protein [Cytophagaceae bacterium]|nr:T9SS type A sorting domain-containing protein [Cytophagaceae bacterium]
MKKLILPLLSLIFSTAVAQVQNPSTGVYVGATGFVDNFTSATSWASSPYGWFTGSPSQYSVTQTGNGFLTIGVTNGSPNYENIGAYGLNHTFPPINITNNKSVTMVLTNEHVTDQANIRIALRGTQNGDLVDINSSAAANSGGWGTWITVNPPLNPGETRTVTFNLTNAYMEHMPADNTRFPNNICNSSNPYYSSLSGACVSPVTMDSITGIFIWVNAGAHPTNSWPGYDVFTGTVKLDKLIIGQDVTPLGVSKPSNYLGASQLYPNPSSEESFLKFSLKNSGNVKIDIKDLCGVQMLNVRDEFLSSGEHTLPVNLSSIGNGIYYVTYQFEDGSIYSDKLVVLK